MTNEANRIQGMVRSIDQWRNMVPSAVTNGSKAQVEYALTDAKTDIEALWSKVATLSSDAAREALAELDQLRDRVKELEKALEPFAEFGHERKHVWEEDFATARRVREGGKA